MFYSQLVLSKKGALGKIWLAAHMGLEKKGSKPMIMQTNIPESVNEIENPPQNVPLALRVSGHLLLGVVRIFSKKVVYLLTDCSDALTKIKDAFKQPGNVELAPGAGVKGYHELTRGTELADEDELDPELMPSMDYDDEDQQLEGIHLEDEEEFGAGLTGIDPAFAEEEEDDEHFGATSKFEHFFRKPSAEVEDEDEGARGGKRARKSREPDVAAAAAAAAEEEEDDLPPIEMSRREERKSMERRTDEDEELLQQVEEDEDALGPNAFGFGGEEEAGLGPMEAEEGEEGEEGEEEGEEPDSLAPVMQDAPPARGARAAAADKAAGGAAQAKLPPKGKPKRKMVLDVETMISTEQIRKQLTDPMELRKITRDFDAEEAAHAAAATREDEWDPFAGPLRGLSYLPRGAETFACFRPNAPRVAPKKARFSDAVDVASGRAAKQPAAAAAAAAASASASASAALDDEDDAPEQFRSADTPGRGPTAAVHARASLEPLPSGGRGSFGAVPMGDDEEEPMPFDDEEEPLDDEEEGLGTMEAPDAFGAEYMAPSDEPEVDTGFDPKLKLPNVAADNSSADVADGAGATQEDPKHWNPRTRKMYEVLAMAFDAAGDEPVSYKAMIGNTCRSSKPSSEKRKIVAGCFQEVLFLATHGLVELDQKRAYGNLLIAKTELFADAAA